MLVNIINNGLFISNVYLSWNQNKLLFFNNSKLLLWLDKICRHVRMSVINFTMKLFPMSKNPIPSSVLQRQLNHETLNILYTLKVFLYSTESQKKNRIF